ncbi:hypothetical protein EKO23_17405 [Nocardioides guangzhouensis]|uniref:Uncharacterized protein n=1 Tax=Nocardioides guangzhouensis TaxID=2497878 RepID=A0A4Q4Z8D5_9ACTN|nr:hypothetical protein [Nocardioides guangzhouensis]RYP84053.1 hypothetical protein EKO23_17405 [Nocardioides guangzhouensis]
MLRRLWWTFFGVAVAAGSVGTLASLGPAQGIATLLTLLVVGGLIGFIVGRELPSSHYAVTGGATLVAAPVLIDGVVELFGPAVAFTVLVLVVATAPFVTGPVLRLVQRRTAVPEEVEEAALASPDEALRLQWRSSSAQLAQARNARERLLVVELRAQILDELAERDGGRLPDFVFDQTGPRSRHREDR